MSYNPNTYVDDVAFKEALTAYNEGVKNKYTTQESFNTLNTTVVALQTILGGGTGVEVSVATDDDIRALFTTTTA